MKVTTATLRRHDACEYHLDLFKKLFGSEVVVTREAVVKAYHAGLDLGWAGELLRRKADREAYDTAYIALVEAQDSEEAAAYGYTAPEVGATRAAFHAVDQKSRSRYTTPEWQAHHDALQANEAKIQARLEAIREAYAPKFADLVMSIVGEK